MSKQSPAIVVTVAVLPNRLRTAQISVIKRSIMQSIAVVVIAFVILKNRAATAVAANHIAIRAIGGVMHEIVFHQTSFVGIADAHGIFTNVADDIVAND